MKTFEGAPIENYGGRFKGTFEMTEEIAEGIRYGDIVCFLVVGSVDDVQHKSKKNSGETTRINVFGLDSVVVVPNETAAEIYNSAPFVGNTPSPPEADDDVTFSFDYTDDDVLVGGDV